MINVLNQSKSLAESLAEGQMVSLPILDVALLIEKRQHMSFPQIISKHMHANKFKFFLNKKWYKKFNHLSTLSLFH